MSFLFKSKKKNASPTDPATVKTYPKSKGKAFSFVTVKLPDGKREVVAYQQVSTRKNTYFNKAVARTYELDSTKYAMGGVMPVYVHDINAFEPADASIETGQLEPHHSQRADNIIRLEFVRQIASRLNGATGGMDFKIIIVCAALGYFVGQAVPFSVFHH